MKPSTTMPPPLQPPMGGGPGPRSPRRLSIGLFLLALVSCAVSLPSAAAPDSLGCNAALESAGAEERTQLQRATRLDVLLLGEVHTSAADHAWQLRMLKALSAGRRLSLGLEMIPATRQPVLDRYSAGQLDEQAFLKAVGWQEVWGHDPELYLPLLRWARQRGVALLALNAEPALVKRVRQQGLAAVPPGEGEGLGLPAPVGEAYRQRLERSWRGHRSFTAPQTMTPPGKARDGLGSPGSDLTTADATDLERFIDSQRLRDRAMAERLANAHRRDPTRLVVALIGRGHLEDGDGVPRQLQALGLTRQESLVRPVLPPGCGPAPARARLGAYLESSDGAVWVRRVAPGSAAEAAGLRAGDRILDLNGSAVDHAGQVIRGVRLHPDGVPLRLTIERAGRRLKLQLSLPASTEPRQASRDNGVRIGDGRRLASRPIARLHPLA